MHHYKIEFEASALDEVALRDALENGFGLLSVMIAREPAVQNTIPKTGSRDGFEVQVLEMLADQKPRRLKSLLQNSKDAADKSRIHRAVSRLEARGLINKVRHGVYVIAGAPQPSENEMPDLTRWYERPTHAGLLELLSTPKAAPELREQLGVSRQRIEQILRKLIVQKLVIRREVLGERGQHVYLRADVEDRETLLTRSPLLSDARARLLSSLPPETICRGRDLSEVTRIAHSGGLLDQLSAQGLIMTFKLGLHRYAGLTPRGLNHPQYDEAARKALAADLVHDFGPTRTKFLQALSVLGEVYTRDVTYALPPDIFQGVQYSSGQMIQRLERSGLIEKGKRKAGKHGTYKLTAKGRFTVAVLNKTNQVPTLVEIKENIERRREANKKHLRRNVGSPRQASIVEALKLQGPLSSMAIVEHMNLQFKNRRSVNLALQVLEKRNIVRRVRDRFGAILVGPNKAITWELAI
ncbi:hypothetical protein AB4072_00505 [Microvirga sp. 2MCAF38]|uniref:hypothetical protein n=1 Tax=Microvirga sp. 2MCAF38 TaxID=3232989 RepID=UPI003F9A9022